MFTIRLFGVALHRSQAGRRRGHATPCRLRRFRPNVEVMEERALLAAASFANVSPATAPFWPQFATAGAAFSNPFQVTVYDSSNHPVGAGVKVTFTAPASGASGYFPGGASSVTVATDAGGTATAPTFTANGTGGEFVVTASTAGAKTPATYDMETVSTNAVIDINQPVGWVGVGPGGAAGSVTVSLLYTALSPSILTGLSSLTFNVNTRAGGDAGFTETLPSGGPLLPGSITYNCLTGNPWTVTIDASGVSGANARLVTRQGGVVADGQEVFYSGGVPGFIYPASAGVNAAVAPVYPAPADALIKGYTYGLTHNEKFPIYMTPSEHFVQVLYLDVLGRAGSVAEVDGWAAQLDAPGGSQPAVAAAIETSLEARERLVSTWYATYLGRQAQSDEVSAWANELMQGTPEEQVLGNFLGTPEFFARAQSLASSGNPETSYVQALYQVLLGRTADATELEGQVGTLGQLGASGLATSFLMSGEFRTYQFEGYYNTLLHRTDDPSALTAMANSPLDLLTTRIAFESTPEFYTTS
jgi:hypothetical protein